MVNKKQILEEIIIDLISINEAAEIDIGFNYVTSYIDKYKKILNDNDAN